MEAMGDEVPQESCAVELDSLAELVESKREKKKKSKVKLGKKKT